MTSRQQERNYYDERWAGFRTADSIDLARCAAILSRLATLRLHNPAICDLGCGAGWLSGILGCFGPTVAVDISATGIESARQRFGYVDFVCADILEWDYPPASFDVVVSQEVLEHIENQPAYIAVAARILKPGGHLILTTPNRPTVLALPVEKRSTQPVENWITADDLDDLLRPHFDQARISSIVLGGANTGVYRAVNSHRLRGLVDTLGLSDRYERFMNARGFGLHLIASAVRRSAG